jgi:hypothetical protein
VAPKQYQAYRRRRLEEKLTTEELGAAAIAWQKSSAHFYRLGEGSRVCLFALIGSILGFLAGSLTWNPLYLGFVSAKPLVWLPGKFGFGGALLLQLAAFGFLVWAVQRRAASNPAHGPETPVESTFRKILFNRWRAWVGGLIVGLLAAAVLLRTEPLGVTSELSRVARFLGNYFALLPERMEGLDAIRGCASRPGKVCSREDSFLYAPSSLVRWGLHSWRASLNSNGLRPRGRFWHSWEAYFWVGEQWSPLAVRSARCFRGFTPHRFRAGSSEWLC